MDILEFPRLGWEIPMDGVAFTVFGLEIKWYAVLITAGMLLAWFYIDRKSKNYGLHPDQIFDVILLGILGGMVGARLYFVIFRWENYSQNLMEIFNTRSGGLAIYGGIIGGVLTGYLVCRIKKIPILPLLDLVGFGFLIGQGIGRWGNFVNCEAYGSNTTLPWGMTSGKIRNELTMLKKSMGESGASIHPEEPVHPCFFYESMWCLLGFILLSRYAKKRKFDGEVFLMYLAWYGFGRFFIEGLRTDSLYLGPLRVSQVLSLVLVVVSVVLIFWKRRKIKENPEKYPLYVNTEIAKERIAELDEKQAKAEEKTSFKKKAKLVKEEIEEEETAENEENQQEKEEK